MGTDTDYSEADKSNVMRVMTEILELAKAFFEADEASRSTYYTMGISRKLSEADARCILDLFAADPTDFVVTGKTTKLKISPKPIQRKNDGSRGAQMNFWLRINGALCTQFNIHVDVLPLEKFFESQFRSAENQKAKKFGGPGFKAVTKGGDFWHKVEKKAKGEREKLGWEALKMKGT